MTRQTLETLTFESTPAIVAARVRSGILDGTFPPGSQLGEADLATQLGVSRGPVREALQRLIHEGLARTERNRGTFVISLDVADARDVYLVREVVEQAAAVRLAADPAPAVLGQLTAIVDRMESMTGAPWGELVDVDLEFHWTLVRSANSPRLERTFTTLAAETRLALLYLERFYPNRAELVIEHRDFILAIKSGDVDRVASIVRDHMQAAVRRIENDNPSEVVVADADADADVPVLARPQGERR